MAAGSAYNSGRHIAFRVLVVGMIKSGKPTACAHLSIMQVNVEARYPRIKKTNLLLISELTEILAIWTPCDEVRPPRTKLRIFIVARNLPSLELKTHINAK